jgi:L-lysine exporter family protein LysE/ArgO
MEAFTHGALLNLGLLLGPGAQNIFVFQQGAISRKVLLVGGTSSICDMWLLGLGIFGLGSIIDKTPGLNYVLLIGGIVFLVHHGILSLKSNQFVNTSEKTPISTPHIHSNKDILCKTLSFSLLNPAVYLDTVAIIGVIGSIYPTSSSIMFYCGATITSTMWFFLLSLLGRIVGDSLNKSKYSLSTMNKFAGIGMIINALIALWVLMGI